MLFLNDEAFTAAKVKEEDAERMVGEALKQMGMPRLLHEMSTCSRTMFHAPTVGIEICQ